MIAKEGTPVKVENNALEAILKFYKNAQTFPKGPHISYHEALKYRKRVYDAMKHPENLVKCGKINGFTEWDGLYDIAYSKKANWYFGYRIENNVVRIYAARQAQNMSDNATHQVESVNERPYYNFGGIRIPVRGDVSHSKLYESAY